MSMLFTPEPPADAPRGIQAMFDQKKYWRTRNNGWVRIKDMTPSHRLHVARMLMRSAATHEFRYGLAVVNLLGDADDGIAGPIMHEIERNMLDPEKWLRGTKLYRRLVKGLAPDMRVEDSQ